MANVKTKGIIIAENNLGDFDKMLTMLTPGLGKISCVAKGARRPKSALLGGTQLFCFGEYVMFSGTNTYHINSCETIEIFYKIRTDLDKLKYAIRIDKIIQDVTQENQNSYKILQLFLNTLYIISETNKDLEFILSIFKFRLLSLLGFFPQIEKCLVCGEHENLNFFSIQQNGFKCKTCGKQDTSAISINESTKNAIKYTFYSPPKKLYNFELKEESLEEYKLISKIYFNEKLEKEYKIEEIF